MLLVAAWILFKIVIGIVDRHRQILAVVVAICRADLGASGVL